jgi:tartrate dehydrogenase/decarboxylase/D-malate dehydrogenase
MKKYAIAVYAGDGIGIEVTDEAVKILTAIARKFGFGLDLVQFPWGHRYWKEHGKVVPDDYLGILKDFPAIYLGAVGDPANVPDHITLIPLIEMRQKLINTHVSVRQSCFRVLILLLQIRNPGYRPYCNQREFRRRICRCRRAV